MDTTRATRRLKISDLLTRADIAALTRRSNLAGAWAIASTWGVIALGFAALARWPRPITFALVVVVIGGRQLALAILMHEASHRTLFVTRSLNDVFTDWTCARVVWSDVARYREHHRRHHAHTATELDPDRSLTAPFPTSRAGLVRKLLRDLCGWTGLRRMLGLFLIDLGVFEYTVAAELKRRPRAGRTVLDYAKEGARRMSGFLLTNAVLAGILCATGHLWVYSAWFVAYLTTFSVFVRIRSLAEHACTEASADTVVNTRTIRAGLVARATVAPVRVNFHIEHHLLTAVPYFRLPELHRRLRARGLIIEPPSYADVLRLVTGSSGS